MCQTLQQLIKYGMQIIVEFPLGYAGAILHGVFIKRDCIVDKIFFSAKEINFFQGHLTF